MSSKQGYKLRKHILTYSRALKLTRGQLAAIGLKSKEYGLHSMRSGGARLTAALVLSDRLIMRHGGWKSDSSKNRYISESKSSLLSVSRSSCLVFSKADTCSIRTSCSKGFVLFCCIVLLYLAYVVQFRDAYEPCYFPHSVLCFLSCMMSLEFCKNVVFASNSADNLAFSGLVKHSGTKEEIRIWGGGGGSHDVFLNGFGDSSSLVFLGHAQTFSFQPAHQISSILWLHHLWYPATRMHPSTYFSVFGDC